MVKLANSKYFQLGVLMSSAMVGQTIGWNQSTHAVELNNPAIQPLTNGEKNGTNKASFVQSPPNPIISPQSFNLIAFSLRSKSTDSPITSDNFKLVAPLSSSKQTTFSYGEQKSYLANADSLPKPSSLVYRVREGDTITKIASEYQIPSHELIEFNQQLQIPLKASKNQRVNSQNGSLTPLTHRAIANLNPRISPNSSKVGKSSQTKVNKTNVRLSPAEDPYIANLKAEIEQLRKENALQNATKSTIKQKPQIIENAAQASLVSVTEQQPINREKSNSLKDSNLSATVNLIQEDSLSLKLPPLPSSEAYLPNIFDGYTWPAEGVLTSGYGMRWGRMHEGIDIAAPIGTPIVAAAAGVVTGAGWHEGYGNLVKLEHLDGSVTLYGHINQILVTHGQQVKQGEQIAEMGNTGRSTGSHLHFEIHLRNQEIVDPLTQLSKR
jgi:murein DD-endopeptidase MepM/ murein hydrolase activator NlpD